jgi:hypothetical protein
MDLPRIGPRPIRPNGALQYLEHRTGIQHGELAACANAVLGYLSAVEFENEQLRAQAQLVRHVRDSLAELLARINGEITGGPGDELAARLDAISREDGT